jgi:uncharacterized protein involved in exopolysaccharide biosynthesis
MPERLERLKKTLHELESELQELETLEQPERALLEDVSREISQVLQKHPAEATSYASLQDRIQAAESSFAVAHPTISGILNRLIDGLSQMGI